MKVAPPRKQEWWGGRASERACVRGGFVRAQLQPVELGKGVYVGEQAVLLAGCKLNDNVRVDPNTLVGVRARA